MLSTVVQLLAIVLGFIALSRSADRLVEVSSTLAFRLGMSTLTIGMTIVAFGTSAPELAVSAVAALEGSGSIAIGNALGSNIINTGMVLSICGLITPLVLSHRILSHEMPLLMAVSGLAFLLMADGMLTRSDGYVLLMGLIVYGVYLTKQNNNQNSEHSDEKSYEGNNEKNNDGSDQEVIILPLNTSRSIFEVVAMLIILIGSSKLLIWGSSELARSFGISEMVIGLTVIAFGTSLPELAAALACVKKGLFDMLLAMIIGSNIFNLLGVLAMPSLLTGDLPLEALAITRDCMAMLGLTSLLLIIAISAMISSRRTFLTDTGKGVKFECTVSRFKSGLILAGFVVYMVALAMTF
ncbi:calcium/sodium antiporter [Endozoicomonas euniceicola]|uniref:Calcium/sodium antiporter n=1 Tax=Endozoicomonas euniceicola TaxID=1234143 RepID=A0ABY6GPQ4_9GAMM|nr:calcium/sodium antiporter [Endozoicomonas euniceicola]UYM14126.1 calcium/sodium antiporter [Endozoicomonas euniceicola]